MEGGQEGLLQDPFVNLFHGSPLQKNLVVCVVWGGGGCWQLYLLECALSLSLSLSSLSLSLSLSPHFFSQAYEEETVGPGPARLL